MTGSVRANVVALRPAKAALTVVLAEPSGIAVIREVRRAIPTTAVLVFTQSEDHGSLLGAMRAGARGFIHKGAEVDDILRAIRAAAIVRAREAGLGRLS